MNPGYECGNVVTGFRLDKMFKKMDNLSQYEHKAARPAVRPRGSVEFPLSVIVLDCLVDNLISCQHRAERNLKNSGGEKNGEKDISMNG